MDPEAPASRTSRASLWDRVQTPRGALAACCVALFVFGITRHGRSTESVDVRTYVEMTRSIAQNGLPYFDNGPVGQYIALRSPFNLWTHGHLWGIYGPVYPYYAALPFKIGGLVLASVATCLLLIPLALTTFVLTRRLLDRGQGVGASDEWYALAAAVLVVIATPALGKSLELSGYPLAMLLALAASATAVEAVSSTGRRRLRYAIATGALGAAGSGTHLLCLPMSLALFGALAVCDASSDAPRGPAWLEGTVLRALWPTRATIGSAVAATVTLIVLTLPIAQLNHVRFGSYNPFSYGPVPWSGMEYLGAQDQTISAHLRAAFPVIVLVGLVVLAWLVGGSVKPRAGLVVRVLALGLAGAAIFTSPMLREKTWTYAKALYAFTIDQSLVDMPLPYTRAPHTFGNMHGPWVTKSPLQCTPILLLGLLLPMKTGRAKQMALTVLAPCVALFAYLTLRGNLPLYSALGVPWAYIRYTMPALPMLIAAAMVVARDIELRERDALLAGGVAAAMAIVLWWTWGDFPLYRQVLVLALPVGVAVLSVIGVMLFRRGWLGRAPVAAVIALACGVGVGVGVGHDLRAHVDGKRWCDSRADAMRRATPESFALFGNHPTLDPVLAVSTERDVEYADMAEGDQKISQWDRVKPVVDHWLEVGRPVFFAANDKGHKIPWPDVDVQPVDMENLIFRVTRKPAAAAPPPPPVAP